MAKTVARKIIDLEWPSRYLLECGHAVPIAADAKAAEMALPGQTLPCAACAEPAAAPEAKPLITPFRAGEAINALSLNARLSEIAALLNQPLTPFRPDEPINATTLNARLDEISRALARP